MAAPERSSNSEDSKNRVIDFQPRAKKIHGTTDGPAKVGSPSGPEGSNGRRKAPIDYRQRMMANLAAAVFAVILAGLGVWLVTTLNHMRQTQDCIMMGLRNCGDGSSPNS